MSDRYPLTRQQVRDYAQECADFRQERMFLWDNGERFMFGATPKHEYDPCEVIEPTKSEGAVHP